MVKCSKAQIRQLKMALHWKIPPAQRQRIQMVLLRESGMTQPAISAAMGVSQRSFQPPHLGFAAFDHLLPRIRWRKRITPRGGKQPRLPVKNLDSSRYGGGISRRISWRRGCE